MKDKGRIIAAIVTAGASLLLLLLLVCARLSIDSEMWPPVPRTTELVEIDDEFIDLFDPAPKPSNPSPAYASAEQVRRSVPAEAAGSDLRDAGEAAAPAPTVTTEKPSAVAAPAKPTPEKTGPDKKAQEEEKARRKAQQGVANAFKNSSDETPDNTASTGLEKGDSGKPDGASSDLNGTGHGSVGGGWIMPKYAKVSSYQTGSIELRAIVDRQGQVTSVSLVGGKAPASGDPRLVAACIAEVKRHRFTRNDDKAPEQSTARIIYTFK